MSMVNTLASAHVSITSPNFVALEHKRHDATWQPEVIRTSATIEEGHLLLGPEPGLGITLDIERCREHPRREQAMQEVPTGRRRDRRTLNRRVDPAEGAQTNLVEPVGLLTPAAGQVLLVWLGQAGFLLKTPEGQLLLVDPYLSNEAERTHGLSRIVRAPIRADEITPDLLLVTHAHEDHLDPPTIRAYAGNGHTTLIAPPDVCAAAETRHGWGGACMPLPAGADATVGDLRVVATWTRHGDLAETESVGFLLRTDGLGVLAPWRH